VGGEVTWRVPSLAESEAIGLFTDRARSRTPGLEIGTESLRIIAEICRRLDGIPLAIELAAARTATLPLDEIGRRLESGLALLAGGSRTAARRQQTLEAAIDWSYDLLTDQERQLLRRLSVFASRFSLDAVETVCADGTPRDSIVEYLSQLVSKSLVQPQDDRYACLETIRAYAREKLIASGELDALRRAHAAYFRRVAESRRPGALAEWLDRLEEDHADLREALTWSIAADPSSGASLAAVLFDFWLLRGYALEARGYLEQIAAALSEHAPARTPLMLDAGVFAYTAGDLVSAQRFIDEGLAGALAAQDSELLSRGLVFRGNVALATGDIERAQAALDEALALARDTGNVRREAEAFHHLGSLAVVRGDAALAFARFTDSLEKKRALGIADETGITLMLRSFVSILRSDLTSARADIIEALEIGLAVRDRRAAWSLDVLSCLAALDGDAPRALRLAGAASAAFDATAQHPPAVWRRLTRPIMDQARSMLGAHAADTAWAEGHSLDFDRALQYALAGDAEAGANFSTAQNGPMDNPAQTDTRK
jgi:predicted ATPase